MDFTSPSSRAPRLILLLASVLAVTSVACGGDDNRGPGPGTDAGPRLDSSVPVDAGPGSDAGPEADAGSGTDAGPEGDAGAETDAGAGTDAGPAGECGDFGKPCSAAMPCASGYECDEFRSRCLPVGRPNCGGFAGATCDGPTYTECLYLMSADFGPCLTPDEATCACRDLRDTFACP